MLWEELSITLDTHKLLVDNAGACIVNNDQIKIEFRDTDLSCIYSGGTLHWTAPKEVGEMQIPQDPPQYRNSGYRV
jgi:3-oxoacyl-[acyl-carrier-protein] synthase III